MKRVGIVILFVLVFLGSIAAFFLYTAQAQYEITEDDVSLNIDPEIPGPRQNVTIKLVSYITDMNTAFVIWKVNGKTELSGIGKKQLQITSGEIGELTTIDISIRPESGELLQKQLIIRPAEIDILWEGIDGYTPPFYRGRSLPVSEGIIRVLAIPQIKDASGIVDTSNFTFQWKRNNKVLGNSSGYGKNSLTITQSYLNEVEDLEINAKSVGLNYLAQKRFEVPVYKPKVLFYEKDPLLGIKYNQALGSSINLSSGEKTIIAEPYFFGPFYALSDEIEYKWKINSESVETPKIRNVLTIKKTDNQKGVASIELEVKQLLRLFLDGKTRIDVNLQ